MILRSFLKGVGSILDLFPTMPDHDFPRTDAEAFQRDWEALVGDWHRIGADHCEQQSLPNDDAAKEDAP